MQCILFNFMSFFGWDPLWKIVHSKVFTKPTASNRNMKWQQKWKWFFFFFSFRFAFNCTHNDPFTVLVKPSRFVCCVSCQAEKKRKEKRWARVRSQLYMYCTKFYFIHTFLCMFEAFHTRHMNTYIWIDFYEILRLKNNK